MPVLLIISPWCHLTCYHYLFSINDRPRGLITLKLHFWQDYSIDKSCIWNAKVESQETPGVTGKFGLGIRNEAGQRLIEFCEENALVIANTLFQQHKRRLYTWTSPEANTKIILMIFFVAKDGEALYSQQKQDRELTVAQIMNTLSPNSDLN